MYIVRQDNNRSVYRTPQAESPHVSIRLAENAICRFRLEEETAEHILCHCVVSTNRPGKAYGE